MTKPSIDLNRHEDRLRTALGDLKDAAGRYGEARAAAQSALAAITSLSAEVGVDRSAVVSSAEGLLAAAAKAVR